MEFPRASGILLHITSLPSPFGVGDLGPAAYEFVDFLAEAKQRYWQILPLGQTGYGNSPYSCYSAFAGNIFLISLERMADEGLLNGLPEPAAGADEKADYGYATDVKTRVLKDAFEIFRRTSEAELIDDFHRFCDENGYWLEDYSLYRAVMLSRDHEAWTEWDDALKHREHEALAAARKELDDEVFAQKFYQYIFFRQWRALKGYANEKGISVIGDMPIYLTGDSCDVWCDQDQFKLDEDGKPTFVAGVPPDAFSKTGQLWGFPVYDWEKMRENGFAWWIERVRFNLTLFDIVRIDHFIGLTRAWEVPAADKTAENGEWMSVPGRDLFSVIRARFGDPPLIAEDLGEVTPEVEDLRDSFGIPGMRVLQFAFGGDASNLHMPHNYIQNCVVYTGTHDNDTVVGWYKARKKEKRTSGNGTLDHCLKYLRAAGKEINWDFIASAAASTADIAIVPMQDVLGLDNSARMNLPASTGDNWAWRMRKGDASAEIAARLAGMNILYGRV